jgi:hypothetical protein
MNTLRQTKKKTNEDPPRNVSGTASGLFLKVTTKMIRSFRICKKIKVKCTLVQALRLYSGRTAHRGSRGIALLYRH